MAQGKMMRFLDKNTSLILIVGMLIGVGALFNALSSMHIQQQENTQLLILQNELEAAKLEADALSRHGENYMRITELTAADRYYGSTTQAMSLCRENIDGKAHPATMYWQVATADGQPKYSFEIDIPGEPRDDCHVKWSFTGNNVRPLDCGEYQYKLVGRFVNEYDQPKTIEAQSNIWKVRCDQ